MEIFFFDLYYWTFILNLLMTILTALLAYYIMDRKERLICYQNTVKFVYIAQFFQLTSRWFDIKWTHSCGEKQIERLTCLKQFFIFSLWLISNESEVQFKCSTRPLLKQYIKYRRPWMTLLLWALNIWRLLHGNMILYLFGQTLSKNIF